MKITKFTHSCLYIQSPERSVLVDPGDFSWESDAFSMDAINALDRIAITHEHGDHMHIPFIEALVAKFPDVHIVANESIKSKLVSAGIDATIRPTTACTVAFESFHDDRLPWAPSIPEQTGFHILESLTHPGDSMKLTETKRILAIPMTAPWGAFGEAMQKVIDLKPEYVLPIHDWHWNEAARAGAYETATALLAKHDITFVSLQDGQPIEL